MDAIIYYILLPFIYGISILPFRLLYILSDFFYLVIYYVWRYRKKVVATNLRNAFPEKNEREIQKIMRDFYKAFCDIIVETIKELTISKKSFEKHAKTENLDKLYGYMDRGESILLVTGHFGSWEFGCVYLSLVFRHFLDGIYRPLSNKYFDGLLYKIRTRFGIRLIAMKGVMRHLISHKDEVTCLVLIGDQTPPPNRAHWMQFLNQDTGVFTGTAKIARKFDRPIFYLSVLREKRGFYNLKFEPLILNPKELSEEEISFRHMKRLEEDISAHPEQWLWSHRRWKHALPEGKQLYKESV